MAVRDLETIGTASAFLAKIFDTAMARAPAQSVWRLQRSVAVCHAVGVWGFPIYTVRAVTQSRARTIPEAVFVSGGVRFGPLRLGV